MKNFREYHLEQLKNSEDAKEYLEGALETYEEDGNKEAFFKALRDVAESQRGLTKLSQITYLNRQNLYRILSSKKNPKLETVAAILDGLGFRLSIMHLHSNPLCFAGKNM